MSLSIRRLSAATQRDLAEDRLLDIFIAAEAFYLANDGNTELGYRLALRAALWAEDIPNGWTQRQIYDHTKRGYALRSIYAHGSEPRPRDVRIGNRQVDLDTFVSTTEEILRAAINKALRLHSDQAEFSINWEGLVLGDENERVSFT